MAKISTQTWTFGVIGVLLLVAIYFYMSCKRSGSKEKFHGYTKPLTKAAPYVPNKKKGGKEKFGSFRRRKEGFESRSPTDKSLNKSRPAPFDATRVPDEHGSNEALLPQGDASGVRIPGVIEDGVMKIDADVTRHFTMNPPRRNMNLSIRKDPEIPVNPEHLKNFNQSSITENPFRYGFEIKSEPW